MGKYSIIDEYIAKNSQGQSGGTQKQQSGSKYPTIDSYLGLNQGTSEKQGTSGSKYPTIDSYLGLNQGTSEKQGTSGTQGATDWAAQREKWKNAGDWNKTTKTDSGTGTTDAGTATKEREEKLYGAMSDMDAYEKYIAGLKRLQQEDKKSLSPISDSDYSGWVTDPLTEQNYIDAMRAQGAKVSVTEDERRSTKSAMQERAKEIEAAEGVRNESYKFGSYLAAQEELHGENAQGVGYEDYLSREQAYEAKLKELEELENSSSYITTTEAYDSYRQQREALISELETMDSESGHPERYYDETARQGGIIGASFQQYAAGLAARAGSDIELGMYLHDKSSDDDRAIAESEYAGWATDELTRENMLKAGTVKSNDFDTISRAGEVLMSFAEKYNARAAETLTRAKEGQSGFDKAMIDVETNMLQMGADFVLGTITGTGTLTPMYFRSAGGGALEAREAGASVPRQWLYGTAAGATEVLTEKFADGLAGIYGTSLTSKAVDKLVERLARGPIGESVIRAAAGAMGEGFEEVASSVIGTVTGLIYDENSLEAWNEENIAETISGLLYDFVIGAAVSALSGGVGSMAGLGDAAALSASEMLNIANEALSIDPENAQAQQLKEDIEGKKAVDQLTVSKLAADVRDSGRQVVDGTEDAESTSVNTNPEEHTAEEQRIIEEYKNSTDDKFVGYIKEVNNKSPEKRKSYPLSSVSKRAAEDIKRLTGEDTSGYKTVIESRIVEHIIKKHGANGEHDRSMSDINDIARMQYVLDNYDKAESAGTSSAYVTVKANGKHGRAKTVKFSKKVNGTYYVVEAVPNTKANTVYVTSAYMTKENTGASQTADANPPAYTAKPENVNTPVSGQSINDKAKKVNTVRKKVDIARAVRVIGENGARETAELGAISRDGSYVVIKGGKSFTVNANEIELTPQMQKAEALVRAGFSGATAADVFNAALGENMQGVEFYRAVNAADALYSVAKAKGGSWETESARVNKSLAGLLQGVSEEFKSKIWAIGSTQRVTEAESGRQAEEKSEEGREKSEEINFEERLSFEAVAGVGTEASDMASSDSAEMQEIVNLAYALTELADGKLKINFFHGGKGSSIYGRYRNGRIDINADRVDANGANLIRITLSHELTHYIQDKSPRQYERLKSFMLDRLMDEQSLTLEELIQQKQAREPGLGYEGAIDEIVADGCEEMLLDPKIVEELAKKEKSLAREIVDWLRGVLDRLVNSITGTHKEAVAMRQYAEVLRALWGKGLAEALASEETQNNKNAAEDGGAKWSKADVYDPEVSRIKEQLNKAVDALNAMQVVVSLNVPDNMTQKSTAWKWAVNTLKSTGYQVDRQNFGKIFFNEKDINLGMNYADTPAEKAAFAAIPKVLKRGIEIGRHENHKNRGKQTITFAAPIVLNGIRGNMAVVVNRSGNHYSAHRIVLPDGSNFVFTEENKTAREPLRGVRENPSLAKTTSAVYESRITQDNSESQEKFSREVASPEALASEETENNKNTAEDGGAKWSIADTLKYDLEKIYDRRFEAAKGELYLGETSNFLTQTIGAKAISLFMSPRKAYMAMVDESKAKRDGFKWDPKTENLHGLGTEGFLRVLNASENPVAAYVDTADKNNKRENRLVLVTAEKFGEAYGVVIEEMDSMARSGGKKISANKAITVYDKSAIWNAIEDAAANKRLLYLDKKRSQEIQSGGPGANYPVAMKESDFKDNIRSFWENVKWKSSKNKTFSAEPKTEAVPEWKKALAGYKAEGQFSRADVSPEELQKKLRESERARRKAEKLKAKAVEQAEYWRNQARVRPEKRMKAEDVKSFARDILKQYSYSSVKADELYGRLLILARRFTDYDNSTDASWLYDEAYKIAQEIIDSSYARLNENGEIVPATDRNNKAQKIYDYLKGKHIFVSKAQQSDIMAQLGMEKFSEFTNYFRGRRISINADSSKGLNGLDAYWEELAAACGLDANITDVSEMFAELINQITLSEAVINPYTDAKNEAVYQGIDFTDELAREILQGFSEGGVVKTELNRFEQLQSELERKHAQEMQQLRESLEKRKLKDIEKIRKLTEERIKDLAKDKKDALKEQQSRWEEKDLRIKARKRFDRLKARAEKMLKGTKNSETYAPPPLMKAIAEMCDIVNEAEQRSRDYQLTNLEVRLMEEGFETEQLKEQKAMIERAKKKLEEAHRQYERIKESPVFQYEYDENVAEMLSTLRAELENGRILGSDISSEKLNKVADVMEALIHSITKGNKARAIEKGKSIRETAKALGKDLYSSNVKKGLFKKLEAGEMWQMRPDTFWAYVCGFGKDSTGEKIQRAFTEGTERKLTVQKRFYDIMRAVTESSSKSERESYDKMLYSPLKKSNMVDWGLKDDSDKEVKTSRGIMLQAYMLLCQEDSLESLAIGGFQIPNMEQYYHGNISGAYGIGSERSENAIARYSAKAGEARQLIEERTELQKEIEENEAKKAENEPKIEEIEKQLEGIMDKLEAIKAEGVARMATLKANIEKQLTPYERKILSSARAWYDYSGTLLDEVNESLYGFVKLRPENYCPIHRNPNSVVSIDIRTSSGEAASLENAGFTKDRVKAKQPILLTDIFAELNNNQNKMANFYGYAEVQHDFSRIWKAKGDSGGRTIAEIMAKRFGDEKHNFGASGVQYVENYIKSVAGGREETDIFSSIVGNMAGATLSLNPKVAVSQLASIPTAAAVVGWGNMAKGFGRGIATAFSTKAKAELADNSVWFWQRYRGEGGMRELADAKQNRGNIVGRTWNRVYGSKVGKLLFNWCQSMDVMATASMWAMAEETAKSRGIDIKTDAGKEQVKSIYRDIIRKSQPNYTVTERSDLLRNKSGQMKILTMYKTQSNQNLNILLEASGRLNRYKRDIRDGINGVTQADLKAAQRDMANAITSVLLGGSVTYAVLRTGASFLIGALSAYRDDDEEITMESVTAGTLKEIASSMFGMFAFGSEVFDVVYALVSGEKYYGMSDNALSAIGNALEQSYLLIKKATDEGKEITWADISKELTYLCNISGIPYANALKVIKAGKIWHDNLSGDGAWFETYVNRTSKQNANIWYRATVKGDEERAAACALLIENDAEGTLAEAIRRNNGNIDLAAKALLEGEPDKADELLDEIAALGFEENIIMRAVKKALNEFIDGEGSMTRERLYASGEELTQEAQERLWEVYGYSGTMEEYSASKDHAQAEAKAGLSEGIQYDKTNFGEGMLDKDVSSEDKDRLMLMYGSYLYEPYDALRGMGYAARDAYSLLKRMDTDDNNGIKQEEAAKVLFTMDYSKAKRIWAAFGWKHDWDWAIEKYG